MVCSWRGDGALLGWFAVGGGDGALLGWFAVGRGDGALLEWFAVLCIHACVMCLLGVFVDVCVVGGGGRCFQS